MAVLAVSLDPALINAATFHPRIVALFGSIAVVDLDFVASHQVNSRVRALRYAEFDVELDITKLGHTDQINRRSVRTIRQHSFPGRHHEMLRVARVERHRFCDLPGSVGRPPAGEILEKNLRAVRGENGYGA